MGLAVQQVHRVDDHGHVACAFPLHIGVLLDRLNGQRPARHLPGRDAAIGPIGIGSDQYGLAPAVDLFHQQVESAGGHVFGIDEHRQPGMTRYADPLLDLLIDPGEGGAGKLE